MRASSKESSVGSPFGALVEVHHVEHERADLAGELLLVAQARHPGAAALRGSREIVAEEDADMPPVRPADLPDAHVRVIDRHIGARREGQAEQPVRRVERRLDDAVERQVRLDLALVEIEARLAQLLGVVAPVPWREREIAALGGNDLLQGVAFLSDAAARRRPDGVEQAGHGGRRLRHRVVELVVARSSGSRGAAPSRRAARSARR